MCYLEFGGLLHFPMSKNFLISIKGTGDPYHADLEAKKAANKKESEQKAKNISDTQDQNHKACELKRIKSELQVRKDNLKVAEADQNVLERNVPEANLKLQHALVQKIIPRKETQPAQSLIDMGVERMCNL